MSTPGLNASSLLSWLSPVFPQLAPAAENQEILIQWDAGPQHYVQDSKRQTIRYEIPKSVLEERLLPESSSMPSEGDLVKGSLEKLIQIHMPIEAKLAAMAEILTKIWVHGAPSLGSDWEIPLYRKDGSFEQRTYTVSEHFAIGNVSFAYGLEPGLENEEGPSILLLRPRFPWKGSPEALKELSLEDIYDEVREAIHSWMQSQAEKGSPVRIFAAGLGAWFAFRLLLDRGQDLCMDPHHPSFFFDPLGLPPRHGSRLDEKDCVRNLKTYLSEGTPMGKVGTLVGDVYSLTSSEDFHPSDSYYRPLLVDAEVQIVPVDKEQENHCRSRDVLSKGLMDWARKECFLDLEVWNHESCSLTESEVQVRDTLAGVIFAVGEAGFTS